jgi:hypothetical protein
MRSQFFISAFYALCAVLFVLSFELVLAEVEIATTTEGSGVKESLDHSILSGLSSSRRCPPDEVLVRGRCRKAIRG